MPLVGLNCGIMFLSGAWLIIEGGIGIVWPAFLGLMLSWFVFPFLLAPAGILAGIMRVLAHSHPRTAKGMAVASMAWLAFVLSLYVTGSIAFSTLSAAGILYGISAGIAPWALFNLKDRSNLFFTGLVLMTELAAIVFTVLNVSYGPTSFWGGLASIFGLVLLMLGLQALYERFVLLRKSGKAA